MKGSQSLMRRVVWALTGSVALFVVLLCAVSYLAFDQMEDDLVNAVLGNEARHLLERIRQGQDIPKAQSQTELGALLQTWHIETKQDLALLPPPLRDLGSGSYELRPSNKMWHVIVMDAPLGKLYVLYDATAHEQRVVEFGMVVLALGALCILAAFVLARWVARLALEPIVELTNRLSTWGPGAPGMLAHRDDEVGRLIGAFNQVQGQVEELIAFEREFATNLGHEIRTALAAIASDAELVLLDDTLSPAHRRRLQRQLVNVDAINSSLSSAENLARPFSSTKKHTNIRACVNEAWLAFESMAGRQGLVFVNDVPDSASGWLDPYALLMVARNLIRNAAEHAAPATMTIGMEDENTIVFLDDGPGIPPESLPLIFERFYSAARTDIPAAEDAGPRGPARRGLGLAIAKQVCNRHGWTLNVRSPALPAGRGTAFLLVFS